MADEAAIAEAEIAAGTPYDTASPEAVNKARTKAGRAERARLDFVSGVMSLKEGRAWVNEMLTASHIFTPSFVQGDPHATSFREGERNFGLRMLADVMAAAPDQYVTMCREAKGRG